jgi:hypothetical protein
MDNPRISGVLMAVTYVVGACGYLLGFSRIGPNGAADALTPVALLSVGVVGVISMVRHSVFHRSDAVRMGWDLGVRNNFQIETGLANFAIGAVALAAVIFDWGTVTVAAVTLSYAVYFLGVSLLSLTTGPAGGVSLRRVVTMGTQTVILGYFALAALSAVGATPF